MNLIFNGPVEGPLFVFAHGAGADACSDFMETMAQGLALRGIRVARFHFPYMQQRVDNGTRRPPERATKLTAQYIELVADIKQPMVIGGKSMGGRIASLVAAQSSNESNIKAVACLGYPFHPIAKPEKLRIEHFSSITQDLLIIQGERDVMGNKQEVEDYNLPEKIAWLWLEDANHDLKPRVKSGFSHHDHLQKALDQLAVFIKNRLQNC